LASHKTNEHIAGIIPVAGEPLEYNFPWHDALMPLNSNYMAIERAVHTAALAGCDTIWVVLHRDSQPLIRQRLGEWVYDPKYVWVHPNPFLHKREIPIYYIPIRPKDRRKRDSHAWSALYGGKVSHYISSKISKWLKPKRFLVVSPYSVVDDDTIKEMRKKLRDDKELLITQNGRTFKDETHMPFTFTYDNYRSVNNHIKEKYTFQDYNKTWGGIYENLDISNYERIEPSWSYRLTNWTEYSSFIGSPHGNLVQRPKYMVVHKWRGLVKEK
jgi:hypothetical protein